MGLHPKKWNSAPAERVFEKQMVVDADLFRMCLVAIFKEAWLVPILSLASPRPAS
jgi:hypothetical protein